MSRPTFYDSYDYPNFWQHRQYEHQAELIALQHLFQQIPQLATSHLVDVGAGFGRLAHFYLPLIKSATLIEPSSKMRQLAQKHLAKYSNFSVKSGSTQSIPLGDQHSDITICIRVLHHLPNPAPSFKEFARITKPNGFLIVEFANKLHSKNFLKALFSDNFKHFLKEFPLNRLTRKRKPTIAFVNHHPQYIQKLVTQNGFQAESLLSVSNFRQPLLSKLIPLPTLLSLEKLAQAPLAKVYFGPSLFLLAQRLQ